MNIPTENEIISTWQKTEPPTLSILCMTWNHERFISKTLDSFLVQKTNFPFEVVIGEDMSTDKTLDIVKSYQEKYPHIIKLIFGPENVGYFKNFDRTLNACRGEYVAYCEGDDYWTDPKKLQRQVDFLNAHPDYVVTGHDCITVDEDGLEFGASTVPLAKRKSYSRAAVVCFRAFLPIQTRVWRNVIKNLPKEATRSLNADAFFMSILGLYGKSGYQDEIGPTIYRLHRGGQWSTLSPKDRKPKRIQTLLLLCQYYARMKRPLYSLYFLLRAAHLWLRKE